MRPVPIRSDCCLENGVCLWHVAVTTIVNISNGTRKHDERVIGPTARNDTRKRLQNERNDVNDGRNFGKLERNREMRDDDNG